MRAKWEHIFCILLWGFYLCHFLNERFMLLFLTTNRDNATERKDTSHATCVVDKALH